MSKFMQVQAFLCIDEHGNFAIIGSSGITDLTKHKAIAIIEDEIKRDHTNTTTQAFKINVQLPEPYIHEKEEEKNEVNNVSE